MASNHNIIAGTCGTTAMVLWTSEFALVSDLRCVYRKRVCGHCCRGGTLPQNEMMGVRGKKKLTNEQ
jgi:hypothetical protein